jgi:integrase/recombinase XerD
MIVPEMAQYSQISQPFKPMHEPIPDAILIVKPSQEELSCPTPVIDLRQARIEEFLMARTNNPNTQRAYRQDLKAFSTWTDKPWAEATPRMVVQFKAHLMQQENGKRLRSDATVRRILGTVQNFFGWMRRLRYIDEDPTLEVELPKVPEPEAGNLTAPQVERILASAIDETTLPHRNLAILMILLNGLRAGEVCGLNMGDYQDQTRLLIRKAKAGSTGTVPLAPVAQAAIEEYLTWATEQGQDMSSEAPMFVSYSRQNAGDRLTYGGIRTLVDKLSETTGINFHSHQGRHTFGTNYLMDGLDPHHIMTMMRHKNPQNFRRYTKAAEQAAAEGAFLKFHHQQKPQLETE